MERITEKPRFHPKRRIPKHEEDEIVVKFHGKPEVIPKRKEGEFVDKSGFTEQQKQALYRLERERRAREVLLFEPSIYGV